MVLQLVETYFKLKSCYVHQKYSRFQMRVAKVTQEEKIALFFSEAANIAKTEMK